MQTQCKKNIFLMTSFLLITTISGKIIKKRLVNTGTMISLLLFQYVHDFQYLQKHVIHLDNGNRFTIETVNIIRLKT